MSYKSYNIQSSQAQQFIISDGTEKAGDNVKTVLLDGKCNPLNAVLTVDPPRTQGKTYIQGKASLYVSPPNPDNVQKDDKLIWSKTAYNWNAAAVGGTYEFWTLEPETNECYCTISVNLLVKRHGPSRIDEMSRLSRAFWANDETVFTFEKLP